MNNLATHLDRQGFHDRAEGLHRKALDILLRAEGGAAPSVADARNNLAYNLNAQGKHAAAEELYRQVLDARRKSPGEDHPDTAMSYGNLANCLDEQGRHAEAEHLHNKALDIYRRRFGEEHAFTAIATNNLAMNLQHQRRYEEAEPLFRKALEIHLRTAGGGPSRSAADVHNNLAANLQARGEYDAARAELEKSLAMLRELLGEDHPQVAQLYSNTAALLDAEGKHAEAESLVRRALGALEKRLGREQPQTVQAYANLANNLHNQERYAEAEPLLKEALEMHRRLLGEGHPGTAWAYLNRVSNLWAQGKYREAEELGPAAAASFEAARPPLSFGGLDRAGRTAELSPLLTYLAAAAAHNGSRTAAWGYLERRLGRGLLDEVSAPPLSDAERERERTLLREISRLDRQVEALLGGHRVTDEDRKEAETARRERDAAQAKLVALRAEMAAKYGVAAGKVYDLPGIQKRLPPDAALVTWVHIPGEPAFKDPSGAHWACAVRSRGEPVWVRLPGSGPGGAWGPDDDELPARVRGLLAGRADVAKGEWKAQAAKLRAQRLAPVEPHLGAAGGLPEVRHLIVLPSNRMAGVPLEVLADRFTVSYAPSGTMFAWLRERRGRGGEAAETPTTLLALGDPDFRRSGTAADASRVAPKQAAEWFAPLPATRRELQAISRLFDRSELLLGSEASEQNLSRMAASGELRKFRFLHFATHGVLDDRRALRSALVLAQDRLPDPLGQVLGGREAYDGRLTAEEVLRDWKL
ncbi:MAG TPA: tetratricopeptide repeat protein, partial [Gemmataceae bacterium]